eukprot:TRINITY_DN4155_c0_g1_i4.p1 TRINITY_DN4155_c0_g1~~TRINITY_DN4155_c0_g1_i4.p1  ORF type:complete len:856 (-),score=247.58 TRINITY_DN4155_c0_g1_i4:57-2624(-)
MTGNKDHDNVFFVLFFISLIVLAAEIIINSLVIEGYRFSFFFWLEIIATVSIIPDVNWLMEPIQAAVGLTKTGESVDFTVESSGSGSTASEYLYTALGSFKFFKLQRIVKLYKYCLNATVGDGEEEQEEQEGEAAKEKQIQQAAMKKELNPNELGKTFSDTITRRILIGVVLMYIAYPFLTNNTTIDAFESGLENLFLFGSSNCSVSEDNKLCGDDTIESEGWTVLLQNFVNLGKSDGNTYYEVLGFYVPNYNNGGRPERIPTVYHGAAFEGRENDVYWSENTDCAVPLISESKGCRLRVEEMKLIVYEPDNCANGDIEGCNQLKAYVRLSIKSQVSTKALYKLAMIAFTTVLLFFSAISVGNDTRSTVVKPITKIITAILRFTASPFDPPNQVKKREKQNTTGPDVKKHKSNALKTRVLKQIMTRIKKFIQMGYGKLGAQIVKEISLTPQGDIGIESSSANINAIFMLCRIDKFNEVANSLQDEITVFVNKLAKIVHDCAEIWKGDANRNLGETFLITWKLPNVDEADPDKRDLDAKIRERLSVNSLISAIKMIAEVARAKDLRAYSKHPRIMNRASQSGYSKVEEEYTTRISIALHAGWAVEGVIGSPQRIDATYLSPIIDVTSRLSYLCDDYKVPLLMSNEIFDYLTPYVQGFLRKVEVIAMKEAKELLTLYTFDFMQEVAEAHDKHAPGNILEDEKFTPVVIERAKGDVDYAFEADADIINFHTNGEELANTYTEALESYLDGAWETGKNIFEELKQNYPSDGPTECILSFMAGYKNVVPEDWAKYRDIDGDEEQKQPQEDEKEEEKKMTKVVMKRSLEKIEELKEEENSSHKSSVKTSEKQAEIPSEPPI